MQTILKTDEARAAFKVECKEALKEVAAKYGVQFKFGRIDEIGLGHTDDNILGTEAKFKVSFIKPQPRTSMSFTKRLKQNVR
jgi:hypothetical protein